MKEREEGVMMGLVPSKTLNTIRFFGLLLILAGLAVQKTSGFGLPLLEGAPATVIGMGLGSVGILLFVMPWVQS